MAALVRPHRGFRSRVLTTSRPDTAFETGLRHHQAGDLRRAEQAYKTALAMQPRHPHALHYLGIVTFQMGDAGQAIALIERALAAEPRLGEAHYNLGNIFRETGQAARAEACYRDVLRLEPDNLDAINNLAGLLRERGALAEAKSLFRRLVRAAPNAAEGHANLGAILIELGNIADALVHLNRAAQLMPRNERVLFNLGAALEARGDFAAAEASYRQVLALSPQDSDALNNLGGTLLARKRHAEALDIFEGLARRHPDNTGYLRNLGIALHGSGRLAAAIDTYQRALDRAPEDAVLFTSLGVALREQGRMDEAVAAHRRALALDPTLIMARSNLLFALSFKEDADPDEVYREHCRFDELHARPLTARAAPHANNRDPERRLRVGYLSPDFRAHPCGFFLLPVIEHHDGGQVESYCYSVGRTNDEFTRRFAAAADHWVDLAGQQDAVIAERIRADGIDILVESFGHMAENRLLVMARKPAPVQVSFPMYPSTTGLAAMDYRLMDPYVAPATVEPLFTESLARLPETHLCYEPHNRAIDAADFPRPDGTQGFAFGCFNNVAKIGPRTVALWARILRAVPSAHLVLKWLGMDEAGSHPVVDAFRQQGIATDRLKLLGWAKDAYEPYRGIDLCLDSLRAAGGTTTCDALWMGVPTVTIYGPTPLSRIGLSLLSNVGLTELIADDENRYVDIAIGLATQPERLAAMRRGLRERFAGSPLMNGARYTGYVESAYRQMWREWCRARA